MDHRLVIVLGIILSFSREIFLSDPFVESYVCRADNLMTVHARRHTAGVSLRTFHTQVDSSFSSNEHDRQWMHEHIKREIAIYQRLPKKHSRFIQMVSYSQEESDLHIIFEYFPKRDLRTFLDMEPSPSRRLQLQWALDAAEAVGLVHACGIIHGDIKPSNFLVDEHLRLRLIDFSGSSIDDQPALVVENARFFLPRNRREDESSVLTDLFALGSTIYEIMTTQQPYEDLDEEGVEVRYIHGDFPAVEGVVCGDIINKCWTQQYGAATAVYHSIEEIMRRTAI